ncbi:MAG TPA: hypothetical protein VFH97_06675 [Gemmatimonadales bacterium]|nr:hypothetical protein [Gemmatimonadales bacterium]
MNRSRLSTMVLLALAASAGTAAAQATFTPSFNAPYRAFGQHEFGATLSFLTGGLLDATALEAQYRFGYRAFDIGVRGGMLFVEDPGEDVVLVGVEGRGRVLTHSEQFPLDGALVLGAGLLLDGGTDLNIPAGLSLGRRLDVEGSDVSIVPYVQPTLFLNTLGPDDLEVAFGFGLGADFRLSRFFDARISAGLGTDFAPEGVSISAVWIR